MDFMKAGILVRLTWRKRGLSFLLFVPGFSILSSDCAGTVMALFEKFSVKIESSQIKLNNIDTFRLDNA
jgi:hypothetical protein